MSTPVCRCAIRMNQRNIGRLQVVKPENRYMQTFLDIHETDNFYADTTKLAHTCTDTCGNSIIRLKIKQTPTI